MVIANLEQFILIRLLIFVLLFHLLCLYFKQIKLVCYVFKIILELLIYLIKIEAI